jgi:uncharacterized repeat protein (TIGR01451 family)
LGDPEMPVWTKVPNELLVSTNPTSVPIGTNQIRINANNPFEAGTEVTICLMQENEYSVQTVTSTGGAVYADFLFTSNNIGNIHVTTTAHNYIPKELDIPVTASTNPHLYVSNLTFHDNNIGNNDNMLDAGETIDLDIELTNSGGATATNISAELFSNILDEDFETSTLPINWNSNQIVGAGNWSVANQTFHPTGGGTSEGLGLIYFNSFDLSSGDNTRLETNDIIVNSSILSFWMYHDNASGNDRIQMQINENASGWINIPSALFQRNNGSTGWYQHTVDLSSYSSINNPVKIGFLASAGGNGNDIYLDKIVVSSPYVTMPSNILNYSNINSNSTSSSSVTFSINEYTPDLEFVGFTLKTVSNSTNVFYDDFNIQVTSPELFQADKDYTFITDLNSNNSIDPGDIISLNIELFNDGTAQAVGLNNAVLSVAASSIGYAVINQNTSTYNNIEHLEFKDNNIPYEIAISSSYSGNINDIEFVLTLQNSYGKQWSYTFTLEEPLPILCDDFYSEAYVDRIVLTWNPSLTPSVGYNVYRCDGNVTDPNDESNYSKINILPNMPTTYTDHTVGAFEDYYYIIKSVSPTGNESIASCPLYSWTSLPYHLDWPEELGLVRRTGNVNVIDVTGNGKLEIFTTGMDDDNGEGRLFGYTQDREELYDIDNNSTSKVGIAQYDTSPNYVFDPVLGDIDNDGIIESLVIANNKLYAYKTTGDQNEDNNPDMVNGFPVNIGMWGLNTVALSDLDNDSDLEILITSGNGRFKIIGFNNISENWEIFTTITQSYSNAPDYSSPVIADLNNDGIKEIIVTSLGDVQNSITSKINVWNLNGTSLSDYNGSNPFFEADNNRSILTTPAVADLDGNGSREIIITLRTQLYDAWKFSDGWVYILQSNGSFFPNWSSSDNKTFETGVNYAPAIAVGDIHSTSGKEIVLSGDNLYAWNKNGSLLSGFPQPIGSNVNNHKSTLLADVDSDSDIEIIIPHDGYSAYNNDGTKVTGWPIRSTGSYGSFVIADIDNNGKNEIMASTGLGTIEIWDTEGDADKIEWGHYKNNTWNTGTDFPTLDILHDNSVCADNDATAVVSGGKKPYTYLWSDSQTNRTAINLPVGTHSVTVTDNAGYIISRNFEIIDIADASYSDNYTINNSQTWSDLIRLEGNLIIADGGVLTLTGTLNVPYNSKIIVEEGGELKVNGGTITNTCDKMWYGIEIQGDAGTSQYISNNEKGLVYLNGGTIENAKYAITSFNGGIVQAYNSNFFNNYCSTKLNSFTNPGADAGKNLSYFTNCNFEVNKEALNNGYHMTNSFIAVYYNGGKIDMKGNTFTVDNTWTGSSRGTAIKLYSSTADINYRCTTPLMPGQTCPTGNRDNSIFNGMNYGIYASASTASSVEVNECVFNNNYRSVDIVGNANTATITKNIFNAGNNTSGYHPYSVYLVNNTNYTIEENTFNGNGASDAGVYAYNSGSASNEVYKNTFNGYTRMDGASAVIAYKKNSNFIYEDNFYDGFAGLEFRCNHFENYSGSSNYAIAVVDGNMRKNQGNSGGTTTELAGNTFDDSGDNAEADFYVDDVISPTYKIDDYYYFQHGDDAQIVDYSADVTAIPDYTIDFIESSACPSHIDVPPPPRGMRSMQTSVTTLDAEIVNNEDELKSLVDNGNTGVLLSQTETATDNNFTDVSDKLKQSDGYLSDAVAKEYINSTVEQDFVKASTLVQVSPLPEQAKKELEKIDMNPTLKYIVKQHQQGKNIREQKEHIIANKKHNRQMLIRNAIRHTLADTLPETIDSLILFLQTRDELENKYTLVNLQIKNKSFSDVLNELGNLNAIKTDYSISKQDEITTFVDLQNIVLNIAESDNNMFESIVEENITFLNTLAEDDNSIFQATAWSLLMQSEKGHFEEQVVLPQHVRCNYHLQILILVL